MECFNLHTHGYKYYSTSPLKMEAELLISKITESVLAQNMSCLYSSLPTYLSNMMVSTTQTPPQIKSQEVISHIKQHFMASPRTSPMAFMFVKCSIKGWVHLTMCCLIDYNLLQSCKLVHILYIQKYMSIHLTLTLHYILAPLLPSRFALGPAM